MMKGFHFMLITAISIASCKKQAANNLSIHKQVNADRSQAVIIATPATHFDSLFTRYKKGEWTGGDVAYSHLLPDGRSFWLFGDSFVDTVFPNRHRPLGPFIHSTIVLTDENGLIKTLYNGTANNPKPFFEAVEPRQLWPNCAFISKDQKHIYVMMATIEATGEGGLFGFKNIGNTVGVLSLPDCSLEKTITISNNPNVDWSSGTYEEGDYVYIYGVESTYKLPYTKYMRICRTSRIDPLKSLEFFTGTGWSKDSAKSTRVLPKVSQQYTVFKYQNKYYLLSQEGIFLSPTIYIWDAASPVGPFTNQRKVYTTPQADGKNIITYNATVHTEFTRNGELLVGYCTNSLDGADIYKNADNYRPYFIWVSNWQ